MGATDQPLHRRLLRAPALRRLQQRGEGWSQPIPSWLLSGAFTIAWVVTAAGGGWLATLDQEQRQGGWAFPVYFTAIVLIVVAFLVAVHAVSTDVGRRHIRGGTWMVTMILALLFVAYFGQFGPMDSPLLDNPIDLIVMVLGAVGSFLWSVRAGGPTEELAGILAAEERRSRAEATESAVRPEGEVLQNVR